MRWLLALLACLCACKPGADGASATQAPLPLPATSIAGTVVDSKSGAPIPDALVGVGLGSGDPTPATPVDASGRFLLAQGVVAGGNYTVAASAPGYVSNKVSVLSVRDAVVRADLRLDPVAPTITVTPATIDLGLTLAQGTFTLNNTSAATTAFQVVAPAPWVTALSPAKGTLGPNASATVTLTVSRALLEGFGAHSALVTVLFDGGARFVDLRIRNVDQNAPQLGYDVAVLDYGDTLTSRTFNVANVGTGSLHWGVATGKPAWLTFAPASGTVSGGDHQAVTVTASRAGFPPSALIDAYFSLDSDSVVDTVLPIRAHLETPGTNAWSLDKATLALPAGAVSDVVVLTNGGTLPLDWQAQPGAAWVAASPSTGRLLPAETARVYVGVDVAGRPAGAFSTQVTFSSAVGSLPLGVSGTRVIVPRLEAPGEFAVEANGRALVPAAAWVNNTGEGTISWTASTTTPWISLSTTSGTSTAGISCVVAPSPCGTPLSFTADPAAMADGSTTTGAITLTQAGGGQTATISVKLRVRLLSAHWDAARPTTPARLARTLLSTLVYDPVRDRMILFGGGNPQAGTEYSDCAAGTWEFDGTAWHEVVTATAPPPCNTTAALLFDRKRGVVVWADAGTYGTWEYDGAAWTKITGAAQFTYPLGAAWSPELRSLVEVDWPGDRPKLLAYKGGTWVDQGAGPPYMPGWRFLNDQGSLWMQLPSGASYDLEVQGTSLFFTARYGPTIRSFSSGVGFDPWTGWLYGVSSDYVGNGDDASRGRLLGNNIRSGAALDQALPADFGLRKGHAVGLDSARRRLVVVGGTYCDFGCADYGRALPTAFLDLQAPGVTYSESPVLSVSSATLDFGASATTLPVTLSNTGTGELDYSGELPAGFSGDVPYAPIVPGVPVQLSITLDRSGFSPGSHSVAWPLRSDGGPVTLTLQFVKP